jgi:hypothetical protein
MAKNRTAREALVEALRRNKEPMQAKDAVKAAAKLATGLISDKTRNGTLYGTMREEALKEDGLIVKVGTGLYQDRATFEAGSESETPTPEVPETTVAVPDVIEAPPVVEPEPTPEVEPDPKPESAKKRRTRSTARQTKEKVTA